MATIALNAAATNYYFSTAGDDNRTTAQAQNPATPWKSINKLNTFFNALRSGDSVLLKRGDVFYGQLYLSGYSTDRIVVSAYGSGAKPVITGFSEVTGWQNFGGNRYEASLKAGTVLNMVTVNSQVQAMGRTPNAGSANGGYLTFTSHNGTASITSPSVSSATSWSGAQVVIRKTRWIIDRGLVTAQSGNTVFYHSPTSIQPEDGFGFFFQNSYATLDQDGEWYYNATNKKLDIYSSVHPATRSIKAATIDTLVFMWAKDNVTIDNIAFEGSNMQSFQINNCNNSTVKNCDISFSGFNAVKLFATTYFTFTGNTITNTNNNSFYAITENSTITANTIRNTGLWAGMGNDDNQSRMGLLAAGPNNLIQYNRLDSIGYIPVYMNGNNSRVLNNHISNFCLTTDDGGGIYASGEANATGRVIRGNIVVNGRGNRYGTAQTEDLAASGIYMDDRSAGVLIEGNTVANCSENGIFLHNAHEITVKNNTIFNVSRQAYLAHDAISVGDPIRNIQMRNNLFVSTTASQLALALSSRVNDIAQYGSIDSNSYYRLQAAASYQVNTNTESNYNENNYTLQQLRNTYSYNRNGQENILTATADKLRLEYNGSSSPKTIALGDSYSNITSTATMTQVTLAPYTSVVLMKSAAQVVKNKRPVANAGQDVTISSSSVALSGAASEDSDGKIVFYGWYKISGPAKLSITSPNNVSITPTNLVPGVYTFGLKVTDNGGGNCVDSVRVTVLATAVNSSQAQAQVTAEATVPAAKTTATTTATAKSMNLYPNPTAHTINLKYTSAHTGKVKVNIYDAAGRIVESKDHNKTDASFIQAINVTALRAGSYYAEMRFEDGDNMIQSFVKQ